MKAHCSLCNCSVDNHFIPMYGIGNKDATIVWLSGLAPTKIERKQGVFISTKYDLLNSALGEYGFSIDNSYFTHIIKCKMNRTPTQMEIVNCIPNLGKELLQLHNLKIIVTIGSLAFKQFIDASISRYANIPILKQYVIIGLPHPDVISKTTQRYDLSIIKQLHNATL